MDGFRARSLRRWIFGCVNLEIKNCPLWEKMRSWFGRPFGRPFLGSFMVLTPLLNQPAGKGHRLVEIPSRNQKFGGSSRSTRQKQDMILLKKRMEGRRVILAVKAWEKQSLGRGETVHRVDPHSAVPEILQASIILNPKRSEDCLPASFWMGVSKTWVCQRDTLKWLLWWEIPGDRHHKPWDVKAHIFRRRSPVSASFSRPAEADRPGKNPYLMARETQSGWVSEPWPIYKRISKATPFFSQRSKECKEDIYLKPSGFGWTKICPLWYVHLFFGSPAAPALQLRKQ